MRNKIVLLFTSTLLFIVGVTYAQTLTKRVKQMAYARNRGGKAFDGVDGRGGDRRPHSEAEEQGIRYDAERHAQRSIHQLGGKADQDEGKEIDEGIAGEVDQDGQLQRELGFFVETSP